MAGKLLRLTPFLLMSLLAGCATAPIEIASPAWPPVAADEINVHPTLRQLVEQHPSLKVVLRVPSVTVNVTQAQTNNNLNGAYDEIEKQLFKAGFVVRDRALLSSLIDKEGITSYQEIQARVDTDLIIDVSSLEFNDPQSMVFTKNYLGDGGQLAGFGPDFPYSMGEAVASVEAKFIIVHSGEVAGIVTLHVPLCEHEVCPYEAVEDPLNGDSLSAPAQPDHLANFDQNTNTVTYLWSNGTGPGSITEAADLLGQRIVAVLKQ